MKCEKCTGEHNLACRETGDMLKDKENKYVLRNTFVSFHRSFKTCVIQADFALVCQNLSEA